MTDQPGLFVHSLEDALEDAVRALGGYQRAAYAMWPSESPIDRSRYLRVCLDPERREKFALAELVVLCRAAARQGCLTPLEFLLHACGCEAPKPLPAEVRDGDLTRAIIEATSVLAEALARAKSLDERVVPMERRG